MDNRQRIIGKWKSRTITIIIINIEYVITFKSDGTLEMRARYVSRIIQTVMAFWDLVMTGTWELTSDDRLSIELDHITTYPTKLLDQALRTLKVHISSEDFISMIIRSATTLLGITHSRGGGTVEFPDSTTMTINGEPLTKVV